jgi:hypothetical protein
VAIYIGANRVVHAGIKNRKVAIELINNYPGLLVNYKDPEIINRWLEEFDREFPIPTG